MKSQSIILCLLTIFAIQSYAQTISSCNIEYQTLIANNDVETIKANFLDRKIKLTKQENDIYTKQGLDECATPLFEEELVFTVTDVFYWQGQILMQYADKQYLVLDDFTDFDMREILEKPTVEPSVVSSSIAAKASKIQVWVGDALDNFTKIIKKQINPNEVAESATVSPTPPTPNMATAPTIPTPTQTEAVFVIPLEEEKAVVKTPKTLPIAETIEQPLTVDELTIPPTNKGLLVGAPLEKIEAETAVTETEIEPIKDIPTQQPIIETEVEKVAEIVTEPMDRGMLLGAGMTITPTPIVVQNELASAPKPKWLTKKRAMSQRSFDALTLKRENPLERLWNNPIDGNFFGSCANGKCTFNPYAKRYK